MPTNWFLAYGRVVPERRQEDPDTTTSDDETSSSTSSSSSSSSSTSSSSISSSSTTSSSSSTSSSSGTTTSSSSETTSQTRSSTSRFTSVSTRSNGEIITVTETATIPSNSSSPDDGGGGFFANKAAVGATFGIAGLVGIILAFFLITSCIRRRRAKKFDRDVAEAAAAAAASSEAANPFPFDDEEDRRWKPGVARERRQSYNGYGKLNDDPFGYAAAGVVGVSNYGSSYPQQQYGPRPDAYNMHDLGSSHPSSAYSGQTNNGYGRGAASAYSANSYDYQGAQPSPMIPGIAGVGSGGRGNPNDLLAAGTGTAVGYDNNDLRYRRQQASPPTSEEAYGGFSTVPQGERLPNPYANQPSPVYPNPYRPSSTQPSKQPPPLYTAQSQQSIAMSSEGTGYAPTTTTGHTLISARSGPKKEGKDETDSVVERDEPRVLKVANE